jgi:hypothetical protein
MEKILVNKRQGPDDFTNEHNCSFCDSYVPQVIVIKPNLFICKTCLYRFIEKLDAKMIADIKEEKCSPT